MGLRVAWALGCALLLTLWPGWHSSELRAAGTISGEASNTPWSGYWWPMLNTYERNLYDRGGPLARYDQLEGTSARAWERVHHRTSDPENDWWGHCQAWAAAAIMEPQPQGRIVDGVTFSEDDAEALYAETWSRHVGWMYGTRYIDQGLGSEAYRDVHPADFDRQVRYWIGERKTALIMDLTTGYEAWNFPVYAFQRTATRSGRNEFVTMTLTRAKGMHGRSGTVARAETYYYTLREGTNGWWSNPSGTSAHTHPDYIVRIGGRATNYGNPFIRPRTLDALFRRERSHDAPHAPSAEAGRSIQMPNDLGWRLGTQWTVRVREEGTESEFRYQVIAADPASSTFTVSMRFTRPYLQPESVRGDLVRAGYTLRAGSLELAWVQPVGSGGRLTAARARELLGKNFLPLEVPARPFAVGPSLSVQTNGQKQRDVEVATYVKGAPWWVSYGRGRSLQAELIGFSSPQ